MFISLDEWLHKFKKKYTNTISFIDFIKYSTVKTTNNRISLIDYIKKHNINKNLLRPYYLFWKDYETYLTNSYNRTLRVEDELLEPIKDTNKDKVYSNNINTKFKNVVRNLFWKETLIETTTGIPNIPNHFIVIHNFICNLVIDYKLLTPSIIKYINEPKNTPISSILSGLYFRTSILNPYLIYSLFEHNLTKTYPNNLRVFTPTLGWGSYLYGLLSCSKIIEYVGVDVIDTVVKKVEKFSNKYFPDKQVTLYKQPSETLKNNKSFISKVKKNKFDFIFFSPPYYELELYPGKEQSTTSYKSYEEWLDKYWNETIQLCSNIINKDGRMVYIISKYKGADNLEIDMNNITKKYFRLVNKYRMGNSNVGFTNHRDSGENIYIFAPKI